MKARVSPAGLAYAAVLVAAAAVYANSLLNGFAYDDLPIIFNNARVHQLADQAMIWLTPYWPYAGEEYGLYRPVAIFAYAVQWNLGGGAPWLFHAFSIVMHVVASVLVLRLLHFFVPLAAAAAGALVFAVHPVHTEAVANVVGQAELIAANATILAAVLHARRPPGTDVSWPLRGALVALFLVAVLSKENAIAMPLLLVVIDVAQRRFAWTRAGIGGYVRSMAFPAFLVLAATAAYLLVRADVLGSIRGVDANPSLPYLREEYRILTAMRAWVEFARLLFFPFDLSAEYGPAVILPMSTVTPMVALGMAIFALTVALSLTGPRHPLLMLPAAWFLVTIFTVSNLLFPVGVLVAERTLYTPSVATAFVAAALAAAAGRLATRRRRQALAAFALVIVAFGARTWTRNPDWMSTETVINSMLRDRPEAYRPYWAHASILTMNGDFERAEVYWRVAFQLWPRDAGMLAEYGAFLNRTLRYDEAVVLLEESARVSPWSSRSQFFLADAYIGAGRYREGIAALHRADRAGVIDLRILYAQLARAYEGAGDPDRAVAAWRTAVRAAQGRDWLLMAFFARAAGRYGLAGDAATAAHRAVQLADALGDEVGENHRQLARQTARELVREVDAGCHTGNTVPAGCSDVLAPWLHFGEALPRQPATELQSAMPLPVVPGGPTAGASP